MQYDACQSSSFLRLAWRVAGGSTSHLRRVAGYTVPHNGTPVPSAQEPSILEDKVSFTLVQLAIFLTVARTGNMKTAALILNITQPAVSKSLNTLEQVRCCHAMLS